MAGGDKEQRDLLRSDARRDLLWIVPLNLLFALLLISQIAAPLKGLTGDEPHYLVLAHSIVTDGDLDLWDDYNEEAAWRAFYAGPELSPHYAAGVGGRYATRTTGLSFYLAPFYWIGLATGAVVFWARLGMALLYAALMAAVYLLCRDLGLPRRPAAGAWLFGSFTVPLAFYSYSIYPEVPAALLTVAGLRAMLRWESESGGGGARQPLLAGLALALLPWLGLKYAVVAAVAGIAFLAMAVRKGAAPLRSAGCLLLFPAISAAAFALFLYSFYGTLSPAAIYTGVGDGSRPAAELNRGLLAADAGTPAGVLRLGLAYLLDQRDGILFYSPIYLVGIVGLLLTLRRGGGAGGRAGREPSRGGWTMLAVFLAHWGAYSCSGWSSGHAPPGRPLAAVAWVLVVGMAVAFARLRGTPALVVRVAAATVAVAFLAVFLANNFLLYHVILGHTAGHGNNFLASVTAPVDLTQLFPNLLNPLDIHPVPTILAVAVAATLVLMLYRVGARPAPPAAFPKPVAYAAAAGIPLLLFAAAYLDAELISPETMQGGGAVRLVFLDEGTYGLEPVARRGRERLGFWVRGGEAARVDVVCGRRPGTLCFDVRSPVDSQTVELRVEGALFRLRFERAGWKRTIEVPGELAARWMHRALFRLRVSSSTAFTPAGDPRELGCQVAVYTREPER